MTHIRQRISDSRQRKSRNQFGGMVNGILIGMLLAILGVIALMIFMNNNQAKFSESASQPKPKPAIKKAEILRSWTRLNDFTFTFHFHALEKEMATHSSVLAWRVPGMGKPGGLPSLRSHRVRHD